jgi:hypothetical protein
MRFNNRYNDICPRKRRVPHTSNQFEYHLIYTLAFVDTRKSSFEQVPPPERQEFGVILTGRLPYDINARVSKTSVSNLLFQVCDGDEFVTASIGNQLRVRRTP